LREEGRKIWVTDLSSEAVSMDSTDIVLPDKVAIVIGILFKLRQENI
jgi:hypothetical protein